MCISEKINQNFDMAVLSCASKCNDATSICILEIIFNLRLQTENLMS